jgi:hypothetical protein
MLETKLVRDETPVEFFREQLSKAMEHQRVSTSAFTEYYLVNLLAGCVNGDNLPAPEPGYDETPLALLYVRAMQTSRAERARLLRAMGDTALFVSGFFADSLERGLTDLDYYRSLGGGAYARLSREERLPFGPSVFSELAERFREFADVFSEVSELSRLTTSHSVLRLYERWLATGSRRAARLLAEQGIAPVAGQDGKPQ